MSQTDRSALLREFSKVTVADINNAMDYLNFFSKTSMDHGINALVPGAQMRGFALTVRFLPTNDPVPFYPKMNSEKDWNWVSSMADPLGIERSQLGEGYHKYLDLIQPGDVLVIDMQGMDVRVTGSHIGLKMILKGCNGNVIDGGTRDIYGLREYGFPMFARFLSQRNKVGRMAFDGVNIPVNCGGVRVDPGDIIAGDDDGIIVVPKRYIDEVLGYAQKIAERDNQNIDQKLSMIKQDVGLSLKRGDYQDLTFSQTRKQVSNENWEKIKKGSK